MAITKSLKHSAKTPSKQRTVRSAKIPQKKTTSVTPKNVDTKDRPRRGRPVSVDVLRRKLDALQTQLQHEKQKRKSQLADAQLKIAALTSEKRELKQAFSQVKKNLQHMEAEQKRLAREEGRQRQIEEARNLAVARFLMKWDQQHQARVSPTGHKKRKPGRPRKTGVDR